MFVHVEASLRSHCEFAELRSVHWPLCCLLSPPFHTAICTCSAVYASLLFPLVFLFISSNYQTWCDVHPDHYLFTSTPPSACRHSVSK
jgi:hypothetical protein